MSAVESNRQMPLPASSCLELVKPYQTEETMKLALHIISLSLFILIALASPADSCPRGEGMVDEALSFIPSKEAVNQLAQDEWEKYEGNPVFTKGDSLEWDFHGVTCFVVRHFPWSYMMWYTASAPGAHPGFGLATSEDGINWERHEDNPVMAPDSGVTVWGPEVLHDGERYHMWYVSRGLEGEMDGTSHATSEDGIEWVQSENNPVIDHGGCNAVIWDHEHEQYRMFLQHQTRVGRQPRSAFELLTSDGGDEWEAQGFPFITGPPGNWDEITAAPSVAYYENQLHLWYTGADTQGNRRGEIAIGHVTSNDWGESFRTNEERRAVHRELRPTEEWEGRGIYSSGVDYDGENIYIWYAAQGFGFASRPVQGVRLTTEVRNTLNLWTVSPNPSTGSVKINYLGTLDAAVIIGIYDLSGRHLFNRNFVPNQPIRIDPASAGLPVGQYLLKINACGNEIHKRMVLVK